MDDVITWYFILVVVCHGILFSFLWLYSGTCYWLLFLVLATPSTGDTILVAIVFIIFMFIDCYFIDDYNSIIKLEFPS